jgi:hypothetical protein
MTTMYPPAIDLSTPSKAERKLFGKIQRDLPNDWIALHSLGLSTHKRKPWAEIDFVLVGPTGIYCIEVKGGGIARTAGVWTTTNEHGTSRLKESPFQQVASASSALFSFLIERLPQTRNLLAGFGVVTPDVRFRITGPDIVSEIVLDQDDLDSDFGQYISKLERYWSAQVTEKTGREIRRVDNNLIKAIVSVLRSDFDLRPTLRVQIGAVQEELIRWTERQALVFSGLQSNSRVVVRGGAGTGKTFLAIEEAKRLASQGERVLYTCFNRRLADYLTPIGSHNPNLVVRHLHGYLSDTVARAGMIGSLPDAQPSDLFQVFYPELCVEALLNKETAPFDALIVDEGQDLLLDSYLDVLDCCLKNGLAKGVWRVFVDPHQDIFSAMRSGARSRLERTSPALFTLSENCRNTAPIATTTALLSGFTLERVLCQEGPAVNRQSYSRKEDERHAVSKVLREWLYQGIRPEDITVISPYRLDNSCLAAGLVNVSASLVELRDTREHRSIAFCTLSGFKGLESPAIALVDIDDLESDEGTLAVYVGTTRAQALLAVFVNGSQQPTLSKRAEAFGRHLVTLGAES